MHVFFEEPVKMTHNVNSWQSTVNITLLRCCDTNAAKTVHLITMCSHDGHWIIQMQRFHVRRVSHMFLSFIWFVKPGCLGSVNPQWPSYVINDIWCVMRRCIFRPETLIFHVSVEVCTQVWWFGRGNTAVRAGGGLWLQRSAPGWAGFLDMLWGAIVLHVSSPSLLMGPVHHRSDYGRWLGPGGGRRGWR